MGIGPSRLPASDEKDGIAAHRRQPEIPAQRSALRAPHHRSHVQDRRRPRSGQYNTTTTFPFFSLRDLRTAPSLTVPYRSFSDPVVYTSLLLYARPSHAGGDWPPVQPPELRKKKRETSRPFPFQASLTQIAIGTRY